MTRRSDHSSIDPASTYNLKLPTEGRLNSFILSLITLLVATAISIGLYYLVRWQVWLSWPVIALILIWTLGALGVVVSDWKRYIAQSDMGTSTIRGASQGLVEIKGRVKAIPGHTLISPSAQIPCVHYQTSVSCCSMKQIVVEAAFFQEQVGRALLIEDDTGEAFAPRFANTLNNQLLQTFKTVNELPAHLKEHLRSNAPQHQADIPPGPYNLNESVLPVGARVQANANLVTLKASDSYIRAWRSLDSDLDLRISADQQAQIDRDWRSYADRFISQSEQDGEPIARLNALMPLAGDTSFTLKYCPAGNPLFAMSNSWILVMLSIAPILLALVLVGWLSPQDLWPWQ